MPVARKRKFGAGRAHDVAADRYASAEHKINKKYTTSLYSIEAAVCEASILNLGEACPNVAQ
jgi:hypothetical protein